MQRIKNSLWAAPILSGILAFVAVTNINFYITWICMVPLFIAIRHATLRRAFLQGLIFGSALGALLFFWMIPGAERFTGESVMYGLLAFLLSILLFSLYWGLTFLVVARLCVPGRLKFNLLFNAITAAATITLGESLLLFISKGFPWFDYHFGTGISGNLYGIQPAAIFGVPVLSFVILLVNYLTAYYIDKKRFRALYIPVVAIALFMFVGFLLLYNFNTNAKKGSPFKVALLVQQVAPEVKWDNNNGNRLVQELLSLNETAAALHPALILWSESAIPWTFSSDDDLVKEVVNITNASGADHIMGINTAHSENKVYNSAYYLRHDGAVGSRYDKQYPLALIEQPFKGLILPFYSSAGYTLQTNKTHAAPLLTNNGKAGILICNEATIPAAAANMVAQGAQFLCTLSNDGWFSNTYLAEVHFYAARLRAVESRKDMAISANKGYSGLIKASGEIELMQREEAAMVELVSMETNNEKTMASGYPHIFLYACLLILAGALMQAIVSMTKPYKQ